MHVCSCFTLATSSPCTSAGGLHLCLTTWLLHLAALLEDDSLLMRCCLPAESDMPCCCLIHLKAAAGCLAGP